jgi:hypothetical protein
MVSRLLWKSRTRHARTGNHGRGSRARPLVETLEDRLAPAVFNVNSTADILAPAPGVVTLRSAIQAANATSDPAGNLINLTIAGTYKITVPGAGEDNNATGDFDIVPHANGNLTILNTSGGAVSVDGGGIDRVFDINPGNTNNPATKIVVTMQGFTIRNGVAFDPANPDGASSSGGGIRDQGNADLTLTDMIVTNNRATADGGGVSMENAPASTSWTLTLNATTISNNHAGDAGGGIDTDGTGTVVTNAGTLVTVNTCLNQGAGIFLDAISSGSANLSMTRTTVSGNRAMDGPAGGIGNAGNGTVTLYLSTVADNFTGGFGGGFGDVNNLGILRISYSDFFNNSAVGNGGGIAEGGPSTAIIGTLIQANSSAGSGGGLFANGLTLALTRSTIANNTASVGGGGIELRTTGVDAAITLSITNSTIAGNSALNNAGANGGGIDAPAIFTGGLTLEHDTVNGNLAANGGGIFYAGTADFFNLENTIPARNRASTGPDANNPAGTFGDLGGNVVGIAGAGSGNTFQGPTGFSQLGSVAAPLDPMLGPLQNNNGPLVGWTSEQVLPTESLLSGSPAINHGLFTSGLVVDERGFARQPRGPFPCVGAFEVELSANATANQIYVENLYEMLLGRSGLDEGAWVYALDHGASPTSVVAGIESSAEYLSYRVQGLYQFWLHRAADPTGLNSFVAFLQHGGTLEQVRAALAGSNEYFALHGGTVSGFLAAIYEDALGRQADPAGLNGFTQMLAAGTSRAQVATLFYSSTEYRINLVRSGYDFALERPADADGLLGWVGFLQSGGTDQALLSNLLGSPEGFAKHSS